MNRGFKESTWDRGLYCEIPLREQWKLLSPLQKAKWVKKICYLPVSLYVFHYYMSMSMTIVFFFFQDNLSFPLICPDWNADEEILLLEVCIYVQTDSVLVITLSKFPKMVVLGNLHIIHLIVRQCMCLIPCLLVLNVSTLPLGY